MSSARSSRSTTLLAAAGASALLLAGCGGDDSGGSTATWPLTGLEAADGVADGPVFAVKVDNTSEATPQLGLDQADLVLEETVEGGVTRLVAMFHSTIDESPTVGPVRSLRDSDIGIVKPLDAILVASGGAPGPLDRMEAAGVRTALEGAPGMSRAADRPAPYNVILDLGTLADSYDPEDPPGDYLSWAAPSDADEDESESESDEASGTSAVESMDLVFSQAHTTTMTLDSEAGTWRRAGETADGGGFAADNVLVLRVGLKDAGYLDPGGNPVDVTVTEGEGDAVLVSGSESQDLTWQKGSEEDIWQLSDAEGNAVEVPAGHTWIALVPNDGGDVVLTPSAQ